MTDKLDTAAIRAKAKMWHLPPGIADSILALCDALDDARQCVSHANLHADCAIADMTVLRAENERLREEALQIAGDFFPDRGHEALALSEMREAIATLAQKEG